MVSTLAPHFFIIESDVIAAGKKRKLFIDTYIGQGVPLDTAIAIIGIIVTTNSDL